MCKSLLEKFTKKLNCNILHFCRRNLFRYLHVLFPQGYCTGPPYFTTMLNLMEATPKATRRSVNVPLNLAICVGQM